MRRRVVISFLLEHGARYGPALLFWAALCFFLWMFLAAEGLERTAMAGRFAGAREATAVEAADRYAYEWRHGMVGGWPIFIPGFFAVAIATVLWSRGRATRHLAWGALWLVMALLAAELLAPLGTRWLVPSFEHDTGFVLQGSPSGATWSGALPGTLTVVSWVVLMVAAQASVSRRSIWPLLIPLLCYGALATLRPGALGDLVRPWVHALRLGDPVALVSTALIPVVTVVLWQYCNRHPAAELGSAKRVAAESAARSR